MTTTIVAWVGAVTGVLSLVIKAYDTWQSRGSETRERQRDIRADLRVLLSTATEVMKPVEIALALGHDVPEPDAELKKIGDKVEEFRGSIVRPAPIRVLMAGSDISNFAYAWSNLFTGQGERDRKSWPEESAQFQQRYNALIAAAKDAVAKANASTKLVVDELNAIDKGR